MYSFIFILQNSSLRSTTVTETHKTITETKEIKNIKKVCKEYVSVVKSFTEILMNDPKSEVSPNLAVHL